MTQSPWYSFISTLKASKPIDLLDILVVAFLIYELILLVRQTHTGQLAKGILVVAVLYLVADFTGMRTLRYLIKSVMTYGIIAMVVVFQPELRRALEQVGRTSIFAS
ncbi:MAG: TIGR00159 family protein, partial [Ruthenibacterium sp.]